MPVLSMPQGLAKFLPPAPKSLLKQLLRHGGTLSAGLLPGEGRIFSDPVRQIFFGYYDVSPLNTENTILLALRAPGENDSPHDAHPELETGYFDLTEDKPEFHGFGTTKTWNWQQGCRLQWFEEKEKTVIYNTAGQSIVQNIRTGKTEKLFAKSVYALDPKRHYALTLDFARLHWFRRGYGYSNIPASGEGVTRIDLATDETNEILSLDAVRRFWPTPDMEEAHHYINHLAFNPAGTRFMLFHVWTDGGPKRSLRLLTAAPDGSGLYSPCPDIKPSHYSWIDDERLLITGTKDGRVVYAIVRDKAREVEILDSPHLNQDGHPSVLKNGTIVSDTYPDLFGRQKVFIYHPETGTAQTLAGFHSPFSFSGEMRCDLHPRLSPDQKTICVDIVRQARRALCLIPMRRV